MSRDQERVVGSPVGAQGLAGAQYALEKVDFNKHGVPRLLLCWRAREGGCEVETARDVHDGGGGGGGCGSGEWVQEISLDMVLGLPRFGG